MQPRQAPHQRRPCLLLVCPSRRTRSQALAASGLALRCATLIPVLALATLAACSGQEVGPDATSAPQEQALDGVRPEPSPAPPLPSAAPVAMERERRVAMKSMAAPSGAMHALGGKGLVTGTADRRPPAAGEPASPGIPGVQDVDRPFNTEEYDRIVENEFVSPLVQPLSTFSIDVDTAAYSNLRRFLRQGQLPPKDAVRTEELVNYFTYEYPQPAGPHPFSVTTELADCPWNRAHHCVLIGLQGKKVDLGRVPKMNLVFLLDVSGSMSAPNKLPLLKEALKLLVNQLRPQDRVAITVYAGAAGLVLPSTPGTDRQKIMDALEQLQAGGSTAGAEGIRLAYKVAGENLIKGGNNRVILATDGDFNVGQSSDAELERLIEEKRNQGVFLTVLGFGMGNYKDSKMEKLADKGNGNYGYIDTLAEAKKLLVDQLTGTLVTIAKDVKLQLEFNPAKVKGYRLVGYENRLLAAEDFNDDSKDAGELGAGHSVTAWYELIPAGSAEEVRGVDALKYQQPAAAGAGSSDLLTVKLRYKPPTADTSTLLEQAVREERREYRTTSANFRFSSAVVEAALLLRDSKHKGQASWESVIGRAKAALGSDPNGYRAEFVELATIASTLKR